MDELEAEEDTVDRRDKLNLSTYISKNAKDGRSLLIAPRFSSSSTAAGTLWMTMIGWPRTLRWMRSESGVCALGCIERGMDWV